MASQPTIQSLTDRLARVEARLKWASRALAAAASACCLLVLLGAAEKPRIIEAEGFRVVSGDGKEISSWGPDKEGRLAFAFSDAKGAVRTALEIREPPDQGLTSFAPARIEWEAVAWNARLGERAVRPGGVSVFWKAEPPNKLIGLVSGSDDGELKEAEERARAAAKAGLEAAKAAGLDWLRVEVQVRKTDGPDGAKPDDKKPAPAAGAGNPADAAAPVFVTKSGKKYHRAGCRHLSASQTQVSLEDAKEKYTACSECNPPR